MKRDEVVFRALASEHRRKILDLLRRGPRTTGALAAKLPKLSRFAVMQHLGVLEEAGLVVARRDGRQRFNYLNAVPLQRVYERWVDRLAGDAAGKATALERYLEGEETMGKTSEVARAVRAVRIENEIRLRAPQEKVFHAFLHEQHKWYPHNYGGDRVRAIVFEPRAGGASYEDWGDGAGVLYGTVTYYDPPKAACLRGHLQGAVNLEQWFTFTADGDETILKQSLVAFGELSDDDAEGIRSHGDITLVEAQLRAWVVEGKAIA